jgi:tRNA threonylcarbamoyl adenosine modification protein YeaZ
VSVVRHAAIVLGLDTGSSLVSVAAASAGALLAQRAIELRRSSELLVGLIDDVLREAGAEPSSLGGVVVLRGPGSFTGLRVGLATALALRQGLGCRAAAPPTLEVLAAWAAGTHGALPCRAVVQGQRGEWFCQTFEQSEGSLVPRPAGSWARCTAGDLLRDGPPLVGFGVDALVAGSRQAFEPGPLAATAAQLGSADAWPWDPDLLVQPIYFSGPATTGQTGAEGHGPRS